MEGSRNGTMAKIKTNVTKASQNDSGDDDPYAKPTRNILEIIV